MRFCWTRYCPRLCHEELIHIEYTLPVCLRLSRNAIRVRCHVTHAIKRQELAVTGKERVRDKLLSSLIIPASPPPPPKKKKKEEKKERSEYLDHLETGGKFIQCCPKIIAEHSLAAMEWFQKGC